MQPQITHKLSGRPSYKSSWWFNRTFRLSFSPLPTKTKSSGISSTGHSTVINYNTRHLSHGGKDARLIFASALKAVLVFPMLVRRQHSSPGYFLSRPTATEGDLREAYGGGASKRHSQGRSTKDANKEDTRRAERKTPWTQGQRPRKRSWPLADPWLRLCGRGQTCEGSR